MDFGSFRLGLALPALTIAAAMALAVPARSDMNEALDVMAATERAFSATSVEHGMRSAFLEYLAPDAVVFSPGPVNGHELWMARPELKSTLIWTPSYGEVSGFGDLGVSLGPWELRPPPGSDRSPVRGTFISVWGHDGDQPWRVVLDIGAVHEAAPFDADAVRFESGPEHPQPEWDANPSGVELGARVSGRRLGFGVGIGAYVAPQHVPPSRAHAIHQMMSEERRYAFESRGKGTAAALGAVAADDLQAFRDGHTPMRGIEAAAGDDTRPADVQWKPAGNGMSASLDLGYSYGLAMRRARGAVKPDTSAYLHVWRKLGESAWKLIVEVENPFPKR